MNAHKVAGAQPPIADIPAQNLLEGLARLYEFVLVLDGDGRVVWLSDEMGALCGRAQDAVGRDASEIFPGSEQFRQQFEIRSRMRRNGFLSNLRVEVRNANGDALPIEVSILPIRVDDSERPLHVAIARPIPDEATAQTEDRPEDAGLARILACAPEAVLVVDGRGFISYANTAIEALVGRDSSDLVGQPVAQLLLEAHELEQLAAALDAGEEIRNRDLVLYRADGSRAHVGASASALRDAAGDRCGTVLFLTDATVGHGAREALEKANRELEHCVHSLAHDLRSPLVALLGFSHLLRQDYGDTMDASGLHFLDRIEQAGRTMEELIHDLLEFSRIGQGGDRRGMNDPRAVLLQIAAEMKPRLEAAGVRLELPSDPPLVYCDRSRLYQVFSNLIGNAVEHMGPCDDSRVTVRVWDEDDVHQITVADRGRGIAPEDHDRIFEVFQSFRPRSDGTRGSGIGLAIVKKIAEMHGGRVWVESEPGCGAVFRLTFPHH
ncbi:MAG: ATP-binding protein [Myxococcota bacterium]